MKKIIVVASLLLLAFSAFSQKRYFTKTGNISFKAGTAVEDINANNKSVTCVFDAQSGDMQFAVLIKGFEFKNALMMEHFNENYMESDKYPKAVFKGKITNLDKINFQKDGTYNATVKGILDLHGVQKEILTSGTFKVTGETVLVIANFDVLLQDYKIAIPNLVKDKIAKAASIIINCNNSILK